MEMNLLISNASRGNRKLPALLDYRKLKRPGSNKYSSTHTDYFEIEGHSMTNDTHHSIPHDSKVNAVKLPRNPKCIPLNIPVIIERDTYINAESLLKIITKVDIENGWIQCESLNPSYEFAPFKVYLEDVTDIYEVVNVIIP